MRSSFKRTLLVGSVLIAAVLGAATWKYVAGIEPADRLILSGVVEADEIRVGSRVSGRIAEVLVSEGQSVSAGQALVRFESHDLQARSLDARAAQESARANLEKLMRGFRIEEIEEARAQAQAARMNLLLAKNGPRPQEIDAARAELEAANADLRVAKLTLQRLEALSRDGVTSRQDYDNARAAYDRATAARDAAGQRLDILLAGTRSEEIDRAESQYQQAAARLRLVERGSRPEDIEAARAELTRTRAAIDAIEIQLRELEVVAPVDSFVEALRVRPGDLLTPNSPVATLVEIDRLWIRAFVPAPELGHAQLGKSVTIHVDTYPGEGFTGRIEHVSNRGEFTPRNVQTREERGHQVFAIRVRVEGGGRLRPGMAADVVIMK